MSRKKVRIGGWVDKKLKAELLKWSQAGSTAKGKAGKLSQGKLLETFLSEALATRKPARPKRRPY